MVQQLRPGDSLEDAEGLLLGQTSAPTIIWLSQGLQGPWAAVCKLSGLVSSQELLDRGANYPPQYLCRDDLPYFY